jgi:hypothetical protein
VKGAVASFGIAMGGVGRFTCCKRSAQGHGPITAVC